MSFHTVSRRSQPPLALAVPLSRFTSQVGGGSAFYVRPLRTMQPKRQAGMFTKFLVGVVVFLVVFWVAFGFTREGRRVARIDAARKHAEVVSQLLAKDKRFEAVRVSE